MDKKLHQANVGLSLEGRQLQRAFSHEGRLPVAYSQALEGPLRRRPHISHVSPLEGPRAPLRAALERRYRLEGKPHDLIRREGIGPALVSTTNRRK